LALRKEIIDKMTALGIHCRGLHRALLVGDFTALYRITPGERTVERMNGIMRSVGQVSAMRKLLSPSEDQ
jgi:hypothetical protein